ncbi:hypothetical protein [Dactylosporangium sp. CA-139066]|uniref:hypothetical protein n=1 Tax=Dactylosporangium sp. CA-139066 TaxID=3239930 RepID=UPI003D91BA64
MELLVGFADYHGPRHFAGLDMTTRRQEPSGFAVIDEEHPVGPLVVGQQVGDEVLLWRVRRHPPIQLGAGVDPGEHVVAVGGFAFVERDQPGDQRPHPGVSAGRL